MGASKFEFQKHLSNLQRRHYSYITLTNNLFYYILLVPFKLTWNVDTGSFTFEKNVLKEFGCAFLQLLNFVTSFQVCFDRILEISKEGASIKLVFSLMDAVTSVSLYYYLIHLLWRRQQQYLQLVNQTYPYSLRTSCIKYILFCCYSAFHLLFIRIFGMKMRPALKQGDKIARSICQFIGNNISDDVATLHAIHTLLKYFIAIVKLLSSTFQVLHVVFIFSLILTIRQVWKAHCAQIQRRGLPFERGVSIYHEMKRHMDCANELMTVPMFLIYISNVAFYADLIGLFECNKNCDIKGMLGITNTLLYTVINIAIWTVSAQIHHEIQSTMKSWTYEFHRGSNTQKQTQLICTDDRIKLLSFHNEVETDGLGVSCKFFTITYSSFGSMFGLIITYAIVVYQIAPTSA